VWGLDIIKPLLELSKTRKIFHSEADFQFALAWEIQKLYPKAKVRLEYCPAEIEPTMHIDILVVIDDYWYPIELKYKTLGCNKTFEGEIFKLKNQGDQDTGRYDFLKDVQRIEELSRELPNFKKGYSIFLTNDPSYWSDSGRIDTAYHQFRLCEGLNKTGSMNWANHAGKGTIKGRENMIVLENNYQIQWQQYCKIDDKRSGVFKYLVLPLEI
jgi:hypothetical protein